MSVVRPFRAIRYATSQSGDLSSRLAPPYDVLTEQDKRSMLARDPRNFVKIDLPHTPPKSAGPAEAYEASKDTLRTWLSDGTMVQDHQPAIYVYHQVYRQGDADYVRKMFFARLRLEPFGTGSVFPHARTLGGPNADRLGLTKATGANLSPIFGLYRDSANHVAGKLASVIGREPLAVGTLDGVESRIWAVTDPTVIADVTRLMAEKPIYIADGHHRYGTGVLYRDWLVQQKGKLPSEHPANYVLCVFCAMDDPGLLILPTHRVLPAVKASAETFRGDPRLEVLPLDGSDPDGAVRALARLGPQALAVHVPGSSGYFAIRPRSKDILDQFEPDHSPAWRGLGLAFLHAYVLDRSVFPKLGGGKEPAIQYIKSAPAAVAAAAETGGIAFLMQPTTMAELAAVCGAGDLMPQKSTYFFPKLASGLVINPLSD